MKERLINTYNVLDQTHLLGLLQLIWETLISQVLVVLVEVEKVKARVALSVDRLPMST